MGDYKLILGIIVCILGVWLATHGFTQGDTFVMVLGIVNTLVGGIKTTLHSKDGDYNE